MRNDQELQESQHNQDGQDVLPGGSDCLTQSLKDDDVTNRRYAEEDVMEPVLLNDLSLSQLLARSTENLDHIDQLYDLQLVLLEVMAEGIAENFDEEKMDQYLDSLPDEPDRLLLVRIRSKGDCLSIRWFFWFNVGRMAGRSLFFPQLPPNVHQYPASAFRSMPLKIRQQAIEIEKKFSKLRQQYSQIAASRKSMQKYVRSIPKSLNVPSPGRPEKS